VVVVGVFLIGYYYLAGVVAFLAVLMNLIIIMGVLSMHLTEPPPVIAPETFDHIGAPRRLMEVIDRALAKDRNARYQSIDELANAVREVCGGGTVTCRFTHVYPDGPAPYYTILAPAARGSELEQWAQIKRAASDAVIECGGTITHHHAVGRDHRPWYDRQRPEPFAQALRAAKRAVDPSGALNPGVLIDA